MKSCTRKHIISSLKLKYYTLPKFVLLICVIAFNSQLSATTRNAATEADFNAAYTSSASSDIINLTSNIVLTTYQNIAKNITIEGNGFYISVLQPGLDDNGLAVTSPSTFRAFLIAANITVTINNLTIKGGGISTGYGGAIYVTSGGTLKLNSCVVSNSRNSSSGYFLFQVI